MSLKVTTGPELNEALALGMVPGWQGVIVEVDGQELKELRDFTLTATVDDVVRAHATIYATRPIDLTFVGKAHVEIRPILVDENLVLEVTEVPGGVRYVVRRRRGAEDS
jgi:hypothetical protein